MGKMKKQKKQKKNTHTQKKHTKNTKTQNTHTHTQTPFNQPPHMKTLNFFSPGFDVKFGYQTRNGEIQNKFYVDFTFMRAFMFTEMDGY